MRAFQIHDKLLDTDGFKTDVMQRHQLSNDGEGEGTLNPMYGVQDNIQPTFDILENRLYSRPDAIDDSASEGVGFSNPVYQTFHSLNKIDDQAEPVNNTTTEPIYQTPRTQDPEEITVLTSENEPKNEKPGKKTAQKENKKKKKKAGKKQKDISRDGDDVDIPDIAAANPMFQNRDAIEQSQDHAKDEEGLYAAPRRKIPKNKSREEASLLHENQEASTSTSDHFQGDLNYTYDPELIPDNGPVYGTLQKIANAEGMSNPLYQSHRNIEEPEEPLPGDIVSALSGFSTNTKTMGEETGQSEC